MGTDSFASESDANVISERVKYISEMLLQARRSRTPLPTFPGDLPADLSEAYAVQDRSIAKWDDEVVAWKVGGIPPHLRPVLGQDWVAGPIHEKRLQWAGPELIKMPVFDGGFAAVEAEFILELGNLEGIDESKITATEIAPYISACYIGVEIASSPMPDINEIGPLAVISDFGNNHGAIVGKQMPAWSAEALVEVEVKTSVDGETAGTGYAGAPPSGPLGATAFLVRNLINRGLPIPAGLKVSTGALTGIHDVTVGQIARVTFEGVGSIDIEIVAL